MNLNFQIFISLVIFSLVPILIKFTRANPVTIGFFRLFAASLLVGGFHYKKINFKIFANKNFYKLIIIGFCFCIHWLTYTYSVKLAGATLCILGMSTYGVQLTLYGKLFLNEEVKTKTIFCLIGIIIGIFLVLPSFNIKDGGVLGLILAIISAAAYAMIPITLRKSHEFNHETKVFFQFSVAFLGYLFLFPLTSWKDLNVQDLGLLIFLSVFGTFIAHGMWTRISAQIPTSLSGVLYYLVTPMAIILSFIILGEKLTYIQGLGALIILISAIINLIKFKKK